MLKKFVQLGRSEQRGAAYLRYVEPLSETRTTLADFFSILLETRGMVVYYTAASGGLAQLGEHYVRNVGVGGSTPLPSTKTLNN